MTIIINGKDASACSMEEINKAFAELDVFYKIKEQAAAAKFLPGQYVVFTSRKYGKIIGKITSINKTTISLVEVENPLQHWRVTPLGLRLADERDMQ